MENAWIARGIAGAGLAVFALTGCFSAGNAPKAGMPDEARAVFPVAWWICAGSQPLNALSFVTDGIHWGTGDFAYLRNAMLFASAISIAGLMMIDPTRESALAWIWLATALWITLRAGFGVARIWPGAARAPLGR